MHEDAHEEQETSYEIIPRLRELMEHVEPEDAAAAAKLDAYQQQLVIVSLDLLDPIVARSKAVHSPDYYRALFLAGMPGFESMEYSAQKLAALISVRTWRACHADDEDAPSERDASSASAVSSASLTAVISDTNNEDQCDQESKRRLSLVGIDNNIYDISEDCGAVTVDICAFGAGRKVCLAVIDMNDHANPNYAHLDLISNADSWDTELAAAKVPYEDIQDIVAASCNALNYALKHMCGYGDKIIMGTDIRRVMGAFNTTNPEKAAAADAQAAIVEDRDEVIAQARELGFTDGDIMGAWFRVGKDWKKALEYLKSIYGKDVSGTSADNVLISMYLR